MLKNKKVLMSVVVFAAVAAGFAATTRYSADAADGMPLAQILSNILPAAGGDIPLTSHAATYSFRTISMGSGGGSLSITGEMEYKQNDVCDAWTSEHHFDTIYQFPERPSTRNTSDYSSWEAKDGGVLHFTSERYEDGVLTEQLRGATEPAADGSAKAAYSRPADLSFDLKKGYFLPNTHTQEIIRHARAGDKFFNGILFDGTDAEGPVEVNTFIGKKVTPEEIKAIVEAAKADAAAENKKEDVSKSDKDKDTAKEPEGQADAKGIDLNVLSADAWHIRMAVFPIKDSENFMPTYEMDMILHDNGVVSDAVVDYHTFKVAQRLTSLQAVKDQPCK